MIRTSPPEWISTQGVGARVMLLDTGLLPNCKAEVIEAHSFCLQPLEHDAEHGTVMADIVAGKDPLDPGMAPLSKLYVAKVIDREDRRDFWERGNAALDWALEVKPDVLNMSFCCENGNAGFEDRLKRLADGGCLIFAAYSDLLWFPHSYQTCIPVGSIGPLLKEHGSRRMLTSGHVLRRALEGRQRLYKGNSVATAVMSGIGACAKGFWPEMTPKEFTRRLSQQSAPDTSPSGSPSAAVAPTSGSD